MSTVSANPELLKQVLAKAPESVAESEKVKFVLPRPPEVVQPEQQYHGDQCSNADVCVAEPKKTKFELPRPPEVEQPEQLAFMQALAAHQNVVLESSKVGASQKCF